jgi:hypothetical protein
MTLQKISWKSPFLWLYIGGALLLIVAAGTWCFKLSLDPERVWWKTINQGLSNYGVTVEGEQDRSGASAKQTIQYSVGGISESRTLTTLTQGKTTVVNEMIGTPTTDYTRYIDVKTDQRKPDGSPLNISKILNVWTKGEFSGRSFSQAVFGTSLPIGGMGVPIGNMPHDTRIKLMKQIKDDKVYQIDSKKTKKETVHGRLIYTFDAKVTPMAYVASIKEFAKGLGLQDLDQVHPDDYKAQPPFRLLITVDARAGHVLSIVMPESGNKQTFASYGLPVTAEIPKKTIPVSELQKRLTSLQ